MKNKQVMVAVLSFSTIVIGIGPALSEQARVTGSLKTTEGVPVTGYPVILQGLNHNVVAVTDVEGMFSAQVLESGEYRVVFPSADELNRSITVPHEDKKWWSTFISGKSGQVVEAGEFELEPMTESEEMQIEKFE